ncbi:MAG: biotin/lipoyl-containing protein [Spirochaetota bacterium]|nr:biotin/lipoyl-containing protein [Spirochaetota bacterium]
MSGSNNKIEVKAPMSGVFYRKPAPDKAPYVEVGDEVKKKQVLALLETMKVFQKIKSPIDGKIVEILAENEATLKDEAVMFIIETS